MLDASVHRGGPGALPSPQHPPQPSHTGPLLTDASPAPLFLSAVPAPLGFPAHPPAPALPAPCPSPLPAVGSPGGADGSGCGAPWQWRWHCSWCGLPVGLGTLDQGGRWWGERLKNHCSRIKEQDKAKTTTLVSIKNVCCNGEVRFKPEVRSGFGTRQRVPGRPPAASSRRSQLSKGQRGP